MQDDGTAAAQQAAIQQQPIQDTAASLTSPFAAATQAYGDQRCGYASDTTHQQQHPQLSVPSLAQAEQLLQQLKPEGEEEEEIELKFF